MRSTWILEETFNDVRSLILYISHKFHKRYGGDFEEHLGQATYVFIKSAHEFDFEKSSEFSAYISSKIWNGLIDFNKKRWKFPEFYLEEALTLKLFEIPTYSDSYVRFLTDLYDSITNDAQIVVQCVLNPDKRLQRMIRQTNGRRPERRAIRRHLVYHHNWNEDRVDDAFCSISVALRNN